MNPKKPSSPSRAGSARPILTDHARQRMNLRRISPDEVAATLAKPERQETEDNGNQTFIREVRGREIHVVARWLPDERAWLVVSAWVRGENDPSLWVRLWRWLRGRFTTPAS